MADAFTRRQIQNALDHFLEGDTSQITYLVSSVQPLLDELWLKEREITRAMECLRTVAKTNPSAYYTLQEIKGMREKYGYERLGKTSEPEAKG